MGVPGAGLGVKAMQEMSNKEYIKSRLSYRALLEQLAEESAELCQAALKVIRATDGSENPTPVVFGEATNAVFEEIDDVLIALDILGFISDVVPDNHPKLVRWAQRLREKEAAEQGGSNE